MRILEIASSGGVGKDYMGPITRDITLLSNAIAESGEHVTVVDAKNNVERTHLNSKSVNLIEIDSPIWPKNGEISSINKFVSGFSTDILRNYDIVHVHDWRIGHLLDKKYNVNCVYTAHTPQKWAGNYGTWKRKLKFYINRALGTHEYNYIKSCRLSIVLGSYLERVFKSSNVRVIPNGIDFERWNKDSSARGKLGLNDNQFVLLYVGRINHSKGVHLLINALRQIDNTNIKLVIIGKIGTDNYSQYIRKLSEGLNIIFPGFISNRSEQFMQYLSAADLFITPSLCDNQPNVILEALSMEVPVIGSNVGGIPDMLAKDVGMLFENGNTNELAERISYICKNPEIHNRMSLNCRQHIENNYTWGSCARRHLEAFEKIL